MKAEKQALATYSDASTYLNVSKKTVSRLVDSGKLKMIYVESAPRFEWSELESYVKSIREQSDNT